MAGTKIAVFLGLFVLQLLWQLKLSLLVATVVKGDYLVLNKLAGKLNKGYECGTTQ